MMQRWLSWLAVPLRWYLGCLFIAACIHKIADPGAFALDIATYDILPSWTVNLLALILPYLEMVTGLLLILGLRVRPAGLLVAGMMLMFLIALVIALARGLDMSCGCFAAQGINEDPISWHTVARDTAWLAMACVVVLWDRGALGLDRLVRAKAAAVEDQQ